jgi:hypothetical protein
MAPPIALDGVNRDGARAGGSIAAAVVSASFVAAATFLCTVFLLLGMPPVLGGTALQQMDRPYPRSIRYSSH